MKSLSQYIIESSSDKAVNNTKFRKLMKAAGLEDIKLVKGQGYFYITSDDIEIWKKYMNCQKQTYISIHLIKCHQKIG